MWCTNAILPITWKYYRVFKFKSVWTTRWVRNNILTRRYNNDCIATSHYNNNITTRHYNNYKAREQKSRRQVCKRSKVRNTRRVPARLPGILKWLRELFESQRGQKLNSRLLDTLLMSGTTPCHRTVTRIIFETLFFVTVMPPILESLRI